MLRKYSKKEQMIVTNTPFEFVYKKKEQEVKVVNLDDTKARITTRQALG